MKDNFYRNRLIIKISVYSGLYLLPLLFLAIICKTSSGGFLDLTDLILLIFSVEIFLPFATLVATAAILIAELANKDKKIIRLQ